MMKHIRGEIKTQTPYIKRRAVSYPMTGAQIDHLDYKHFVWFLCKADDWLKGSFMWEGKLFMAPAPRVKNWIEKDSHIWFPDNGLLKGPHPQWGNFWYNILVNHYYTKWLKLKHTFTKEEMKVFRNLGTSSFSTNKSGDMYKDYSKKADKKVMKQAGDLGELLMKKYFERQPGVFNVQLNPQPYGAYDIEFDYDKEAS